MSSRICRVFPSHRCLPRTWPRLKPNATHFSVAVVQFDARSQARCVSFVAALIDPSLATGEPVDAQCLEALTATLDMARANRSPFLSTPNGFVAEPPNFCISVDQLLMIYCGCVANDHIVACSAAMEDFEPDGGSSLVTLTLALMKRTLAECKGKESCVFGRRSALRP